MLGEKGEGRRRRVENMRIEGGDNGLWYEVKEKKIKRSKVN
ncbi:hypothetical protein [Clostridioides difficile]|nr:hypothetical protein [Clostridioides difficile]GMK99283.1 hypothetical protein JSCD11_36200 [Clostridioides difficile]